MNEHAFSSCFQSAKNFMTCETDRIRFRHSEILKDRYEAHVEILHYSSYSYVHICITKDDMYLDAFNARLTGNGREQLCDSLANEYLQSNAINELCQVFDELSLPRENYKIFSALDRSSKGETIA